LADDTFSYKNDPTGILTDSVQFISIYSECTNISVGYQSEHTFSETQDIEHLEKLAEACLKVDWNNLPVERDPSKTEYKSYGRYSGYDGGWDDYDYGYSSYGSGFSKRTFDTKPRTEKVWFHDKKFNYVSSLEIETLTKKVVEVDLCNERIQYEQVIIDRLLKSLELVYESSTWDGFKLKVKYEFDHSTECNRNDLIEYLPELDYSSGDDVDEVDIDTTSYTTHTSIETDTDLRNYSDYTDYYDEDYYD
jgi:hypothetical protein